MASIVFGTHRYTLVEAAKTWSEADTDSINRGGYLAEIESEAENTAIYQQFKGQLSDNWPDNTDGGSVPYAWLGGTDKTQEGLWKYGESRRQSKDLSFTNWGSGPFSSEPNDTGNQDYLGMAFEDWPARGTDTVLGLIPGDYGFAGEWNSLKGSNSNFYVVEFDQAALQGTGDSITCSSNSADTLRYNQVAFGNSDRITGFDASADKLELLKTAFGASINENLSVIRKAAVSSDSKSNKREQKRYNKEVKRLGKTADSFIYNQGTGELFFNENGSKKGLGSGGVFATLDDSVLLSKDSLSFL